MRPETLADRFPHRNDRSPGEATADEIYEIVESFERVVDAREIANEVYAEHKDCFVHLFVGGRAEDGFSEALGRTWADELDALVRPLGWHVAKCGFHRHVPDPSDPEATPQIMAYVDVFPILGARQSVPPTLYHVSLAEHRDSILARGLEPSTGGTDHIVTANARVYVALDALVVDAIVSDMARLRGWDPDDVDFWTIDSAAIPDHTWHRDVELDGLGAWTPSPIPPHALTRCDRIGERIFVPVCDGDVTHGTPESGSQRPEERSAA